jgi:hypothetical protein
MNHMPAACKVSVGWQIVATLIIIANFWAFYRIRKLRKYLLYVILPEAIVSGIIMWYGYNGSYSFMGINPLDPSIPYLSIAASIALQGLSIYLVVKWSREHNQKYEARPRPT